MEQVEKQETLSLSPALAALAALMVFMGLIGIYVSNQDIETKGVTVLESTLPLTYTDSASGITARYPEGWQPVANEPELNAVTFTLTEGDTLTTMSAGYVNEGTVEDYIEIITSSADEVVEEPETFSRDNVEGVTLLIRQQLDVNEIDQRYTIFEDENEDLYIALLQGEPGKVEDFRQEFNYFVESISRDPNIRTISRENIGLSIQYPVGWTEQPDLNFLTVF